MPSLLAPRATLSQSSNANPLDVIKVKSGLRPPNRYGAPDWGVIPYPDSALFPAIQAFQKAQGLQTDGVLKPDGETWNALYPQLQGLDDKKKLQLQKNKGAAHSGNPL